MAAAPAAAISAALEDPGRLADFAAEEPDGTGPALGLTWDPPFVDRAVVGGVDQGHADAAVGAEAVPSGVTVTLKTGAGCALDGTPEMC